MADEGDFDNIDEGSNIICEPVNKPEYLAWRTYIDGKLEKVEYSVNRDGEGLQIIRPIGNKTVRYATFFEKIGGSDPNPLGSRKRISSLDKMERDLLRLSERAFKKKYPNVDLIDDRAKTKKVGERTIEETD